jgi:hypothetical protein
MQDNDPNHPHMGDIPKRALLVPKHVEHLTTETLAPFRLPNA